MKIAVIGASHAGIACALRAREEYPEANITLYEKQKSIGFVAQSIPLYLMGDNDFLKVSSYTSVRELEEKGIRVFTETVVRCVDTQKKELTYVSKNSEQSQSDFYDKLVLATGSYPSLPLAAGDFHKDLFMLKEFADAKKIKRLIETAKTLIIIGGGAIGIELARVLKQNEVHAILLQSHEILLNRYLDDEPASIVRKSLEEEGIEVYTSAVTTNIREEARQTIVTTEDGKSYTADGVVYATGFRPNSFLVHSQVALGDKGAILVDDYMRTSEKDVFAIGDCSTTSVTHLREPIYIPHASDAFRQGEIAALNLLGKRRKISSSQGTYNLNFGEKTLCMTGLSHRRAKEEGYNSAIAYCRNQYLNSEKYNEMWLIYEKGTHEILGLQVRGTAEEISSYADIVSLALQEKMSIEDLEFADFYFRHGYANPRSFAKILADIVRRQDPKKDGE